MTTSNQLKQDVQSVTPAGVRVGEHIQGVEYHPAINHIDERGSLTEVFNPMWHVGSAPIVYVYQFTIRPNWAKGWIVHRNQSDRIFISVGEVKVVLYDDRPESPTYHLVNEFTLTDMTRALLAYPANVYHAIHNIGSRDALLINMPTAPYNYEDPDKYRLPLHNDIIPYRFAPDIKGW